MTLVKTLFDVRTSGKRIQDESPLESRLWRIDSLSHISESFYSVKQFPIRQSRLRFWSLLCRTVQKSRERWRGVKERCNTKPSRIVTINTWFTKPIIIPDNFILSLRIRLFYTPKNLTVVFDKYGTKFFNKFLKIHKMVDLTDVFIFWYRVQMYYEFIRVCILT